MKGRFRGGRVVDLLGGLSAEREISERSGRAVVRALAGLGYRVVPLRVGRDLGTRLVRARPAVVFNALHGRYGEDGCVQGLLEVMGVPYTGAGVLASALAMDKARAKALWQRHRLPTPPWVLVDRPRGRLPPLPAPLPVVVKPNREGSSVGVSIVRHRREVAPAVRRAARWDGEVLIEAYVPGVEVTVGILDDAALGTLEVVALGEFHSYRVKYTPGLEEFHLPARIGAAMRGRVETVAVAAHRVLQAGPYSRVDLRVDHRRIALIELNTLPGLTDLSYLPRIAAGVGLSFATLCERILDRATLGVRERRR